MSNEKVENKTIHDGGMGGGGVPAVAADGQRVLVDTWDEPELDDLTLTTEKVKSDDSSLKKRKAAPEQAPQSTDSKLEGAKNGGATPSDLVILLPPADSCDDASAGPAKKRRTFCNFHYMTTQGGSIHAEPGDDTSMQSQETRTKQALTLLDFLEREEQPTQLSLPPADKLDTR